MTISRGQEKLSPYEHIQYHILKVRRALGGWVSHVESLILHPGQGKRPSLRSILLDGGGCSCELCVGNPAKWIPVLTLRESSCDSPALTLHTSVPGHSLSLNLMEVSWAWAWEERALLFGNQSSLPSSFTIQDLVQKWAEVEFFQPMSAFVGS